MSLSKNKRQKLNTEDDIILTRATNHRNNTNGNQIKGEADSRTLIPYQLLINWTPFSCTNCTRPTWATGSGRRKNRKLGWTGVTALRNARLAYVYGHTGVLATHVEYLNSGRGGGGDDEEEEDKVYIATGHSFKEIEDLGGIKIKGETMRIEKIHNFL